MKKLLIIFLSLFLFLPAFSCENKYYLGEKYKKEITKIIDKEYPKAIKAINDVFVEFDKEKNPYEKSVIIDIGITGVLFDFYQELLHKTNKYTDLHLEKLGTDWYGDLKKIIDPYLEKNQIDMTKIDLLDKYTDIKQIEIEKRREEIIFPAPETY